LKNIELIFNKLQQKIKNYLTFKPPPLSLLPQFKNKVLLFMKTTNKAAAAQGVSTANKANKAVKQVNTELHIADGLTGKQLNKLKIDANRLNKEELRSFSFQVNQIRKHGADFLKACKVDISEITPKKLLPLRTEKEAQRSDVNGFSFWLIETLVKRYSAQKTA
jgi:hypothetical protein